MEGDAEVSEDAGDGVDGWDAVARGKPLSAVGVEIGVLVLGRGVKVLIVTGCDPLCVVLDETMEVLLPSVFIVEPQVLPKQRHTISPLFKM